MSELQRFVSYINLYEENNKIRNVGFAKIEKKGEQCKIEIHMKGTGYTGISCPVYLFVRKEEEMQGIAIGKIQLTGGAGTGSFLFEEKKLSDCGCGLNQMGGFLIFVTERVMFGSQWDDKEILREKFVVMEEKPKEEEKNVVKEKPKEEEKSVVKEKPKEEEKSVVKEKSKEEEHMQEKRKTIEAAEAVPQPQVNTEPPWEQKWQFILENYPVMTPFEGEEEILCVRLELKDLRVLPKRYWYLGNNSFLLHGFFNYRYLILGVMEQEEGKRWFVGVPGVFQNQEKVMAAIFGFSEYRSEKIAEQKTGQFGYWYRFLE